MGMLWIQGIPRSVGISRVNDHHRELVLPMVQVGQKRQISFHPTHAPVGIRWQSVKEVLLLDRNRDVRSIRKEISNGHQLPDTRVAGSLDDIEVD